MILGNKLNKVVTILSISLVFSLFQNCAEPQFSFESTADGFSLSEVICNPLDPNDVCSNPGEGLIGNVYYLTINDHQDIFGTLNAAKIDDYLNYGFKVDTPLLFSRINVSPRSWDSGFILPNGQAVTNSSSEKLFEWFAVDLNGNFNLDHLPAGDYQLAILSDDGMRVTLNGDLILNDDGTHAPRYQCASVMTNIAQGEKRPISVQYFQGPRTMISMQLLVRSAADASLPCDETGNWQELPASSFSF